jgi:hypothetical protein
MSVVRGPLPVVMKPTTRQAKPVMPVLDQVQDDGSGIQRQAAIPALRFAPAGMTCYVAGLITGDRIFDSLLLTG